ncbi:sensor histidine kinase [Paenibacillus sp. H1-7]|uniref:ATP-binding protein n=1 Tax=Paenibacillus sp. H1-7 TaxID=2282849 RepID=UPI001EF76711|nr:sensor histidine kinase [Paenibacillus sp. H1-7]
MISLSYFKDYLLNIFMIFSPLVFYPYIYRTKSKPRLYCFLLFVLFSVALVVTMSFPIHLSGLTYDFRAIPLAIGSLYGGLPVSAMLYFIVFACRYFMDSPNQLIYIISLCPSFLLVVLYLRKYHLLSLWSKIAAAIFLSFLIKFMTFAIYLTLTAQIQLLFVRPIITLETYLVQGFIVGLCVYLIEFLISYFHMQEEVVSSEKVKIVSDMAAAVAHEIRNPLTTVRGFIQLLGAESLDQEKKRYYQKLCLEELDRAQVIITDYLSLAKPDPEVIEPIHIQDEVRYLSNILLTYANYYNIQIVGNVTDEESIYIDGDKHKFRQALINIGKNAIEAMHNGGVLEIHASSRDEQVVILISDSGVGMTEEQIRRLGTPYYSTKDKGTGLGTMVSFGIIKKMNGKIDIQSEVGRGTKFELRFPQKESA